MPLGATGVISGAIRNADVIAVRPVDVLIIPKDVYLEHWHRPYTLSSAPDTYRWVRPAIHRQGLSVNKPNAEGATPTLTRLAAELPADMVYHNLAHTRDEVLPAAARLGQLAGLPEPDLDLLRVEAAFHDLGYAETQEEHELCSVPIAAQVLPAFGSASRASSRSSA